MAFTLSRCLLLAASVPHCQRSDALLWLSTGALTNDNIGLFGLAFDEINLVQVSNDNAGFGICFRYSCSFRLIHDQGCNFIVGVSC